MWQIHLQDTFMHPSCISVTVLDFQGALQAPTVGAAYDNFCSPAIWFQPNNSRNNPLGLPLLGGSLVLPHSCVLLPHLVVVLFLSPVMSSLFTSLSATPTLTHSYANILFISTLLWPATFMYRFLFHPTAYHLDLRCPSSPYSGSSQLCPPHDIQSHYRKTYQHCTNPHKT